MKYREQLFLWMWMQVEKIMTGLIVLMALAAYVLIREQIRVSRALTQARAYVAELEQAIGAMRRTESGLRQDIRDCAARELFEDVPQPMVRVIAGGCEYIVRLADLPCSERVM